MRTFLKWVLIVAVTIPCGALVGIGREIDQHWLSFAVAVGWGCAVSAIWKYNK